MSSEGTDECRGFVRRRPRFVLSPSAAATAGLEAMLAHVDAVGDDQDATEPARTALVAWLRRAPIDLPRSLSGEGGGKWIAAFNAPSLALALERCESAGTARR